MSRCANRRISGAACAMSTRAASTSESSSSSPRRSASFRRKSSAACCFSNSGRPIVVELVAFPARGGSERRAATSDDGSSTSLRRALQGLTLDEARYALRRALAANRTLGPESLPALLEEKRLLVNRSGVIEFIADGSEHRRDRRPGRSQEVAAGAPQAVSVARQPDCRNRAQGPAHDGHSRLRQEPLGQGHRLLFPASALPHRHDRDLLRPPRQAGRRVRRGLQDDGRHGARGPLVRRNRDGNHLDGMPAASRAASSRSS